jgi:hypothetical protein
MKYIDCDCMIGPPVGPLESGVVPDEADLLAEMDRLGIDTALVRHRLGRTYFAPTGNDACRREVSDHPRLLRVKMLTPDGERDGFDPRRAVEQMARKGFSAGWVNPKADQNPYPLRSWCAGPMLRALEDRRVPTLVELDCVDPHELYDALRQYPRWPVILLKVPRTGRHRVVWNLAEACPNLYLCVAPAFAVLEGVQDLCRHIGAGRLVWGSSYPESEGGSAITNLTYSGISRAEQEQIAAGTIEQLLSEVIHD